MEVPLYTCPLCCNSTFDSKQSLVEHLNDFSLNIVCTICSQGFSTLELLTEHLKVDNCEAIQPDKDVVLETELCNIIKVEHDIHSVNSDSTQGNEEITQKNHLENNATNTIKLDNINNHTDGGDKMYVELLRKQLAKPCLQTQEMKLVKEDGQSRYVIIADEESLTNPDVTIVTKQNIDGTISLTTLKASVPNEDSEMDSEPVSDDERTDKSGEEIYTCNTCSVSFTSVLEHIQNYHNDEDVVVHDNGNTDLPLQFESVVDEETAADKQTSRRMITEAGNIVEAPVVLSQTAQSEMNGVETINIEPNVKSGRMYIGRLLQVNAAPKAKSENPNSVYHKVVVKEMQTSNGNQVKLYNCMTCNLYVTSLAEFKQQPCKVLKYQCPHCPVQYVNSKSLCAHMKVHKLKTQDLRSRDNSKYECEICNTLFPTCKSLKLHKKMHDPIKSRPIEPPLETSEGMPASDDKYLCSTCHKLIPIDYRTIHQNSHKSNNTMNCDICNKKFHSKEYLDMHMAVHKVDKVVVEKSDKLLPYDCLYCARKFARPHEKVKHERIHTGEKPHSCEICGKSFRVSYCLTLHMRTHTGARPYACPHCNKRFKAHSVYNHHLLTHSDVRAYKCPFCPKAFKTSVQLAGHKNSHTKPFSCQHCNRPFASLYAVRVHMEIHTRQNSLKFSCSLCGASYARAFALKDHVKQVHKQDIYATENENLEDKKDWAIPENTDVDSERVPLIKDLPEDVTELGDNASELIIP
ncbi:zinc finger protein 2 homolog isoform X1 [Pararge aegeria]|uniref:zinc finger protein 2 homolog isoform X1 n=1 Tax=Pararge aegeria TaxID=116150 RepID=UPI0019D24808|nr:zinc finger protein 2 homolog isoform X1 [Pararge aegeria]